jgi:cysteinyl-tRNA synthetase
LSGHYSKPIDYSEELLKENLIKWRQAEVCYYELIHANNDSHNSGIKSIIEEASNEFDNALESDVNTHLALLAFFKLVKEVNYLAAEEKLGSNDAKIIIPEFERMLDILGLVIPKITSEQKQQIGNWIMEREQLRKEKKFQDADKIRDNLNEMNIEIMDHKGKTIWIRKEKIKAEL